MASLDRIRTEGFRRWYERQLVECHAWLVSCFLGIVLVAAGMELAGEPGQRWMGLGLVVAGLWAAAHGWERYRLMLQVAERFGEQAGCPVCRGYSSFDVTASGPLPMPDGGDPVLEGRPTVWMQARCRKCGGEWTLR